VRTSRNNTIKYLQGIQFGLNNFRETSPLLFFVPEVPHINPRRRHL